MKPIYMIIPLFLLFIACGSNNNEPEVQEELTEAELVIKEADSLWRSRLAVSETNTLQHRHGIDLAVHAHQDIGKQRRIMRTALEIRDSRMAAARREQELRRQNLIDRGIIEDTTQNISSLLDGMKDPTIEPDSTTLRRELIYSPEDQIPNK